MKIFLSGKRLTIERNDLVYEGYQFFVKKGKELQRLYFYHYLN